VRGLHAQWRSGIGWTLGVVALALISGSVWPTIKNSGMTAALEQMDPRMLEAFGAADFVTPAGYLDGQLYALMLPLVLAGMAIAAAAALTVGDEEAGRLELVAALPLSRHRLLLTRLTAVGLVLVGLGVATVLSVLAMRQPFELGIPVGRLVEATAGCVVLAAFHGAVVYAAAGIGVGRAACLGIGVTVLLAGYVADFLFPLSDRLEDLQQLSPWWWAIGTKPLGQGIDGSRVVWLTVVTALLVVLGTWAFGRRDLRGA
jgi:ABC-2 type transport system permease protein